MPVNAVDGCHSGHALVPVVCGFHRQWKPHTHFYNMESWLPYKPWALQLNLTDRCNPTAGSSY